MDFQLSKVSSLIRELAVSTWMIISERIVYFATNYNWIVIAMHKASHYNANSL